MLIKIIVAIAKCLAVIISIETKEVTVVTMKNNPHIESTMFTFFLYKLKSHPKKAKANKLKIIKIYRLSIF